ncbi:hypothetical protein CIT26_33725 [Mesorhizobium temperatum]|uniref:Uncharacterized protein n=1 Tax=Mesorhizobium temperatum TaxID=241416 RepID=A0A271L8Z3_9HYPH|nr:hypothetical protein CIT26_33725 [Mesorhizobium temperatum]
MRLNGSFGLKATVAKSPFKRQFLHLIFCNVAEEAFAARFRVPQRVVSTETLPRALDERSAARKTAKMSDQFWM